MLSVTKLYWEILKKKKFLIEDFIYLKLVRLQRLRYFYRDSVRWYFLGDPHGKIVEQQHIQLIENVCYLWENWMITSVSDGDKAWQKNYKLKMLRSLGKKWNPRDFFYWSGKRPGGVTKQVRLKSNIETNESTKNKSSHWILATQEK